MGIFGIQTTSYLIYYILGIVLLPGFIVALIVEHKLKKTFWKYQSVQTKSGLIGYDVASKILLENNVYDVKIQSTQEKNKDHYDHSIKTITLSPNISTRSSITATAVAAHEAAHAIQYAENSKSIYVRAFIGKACNTASRFLWPLVIIGIIFNFAFVGGIFGNLFLYAGITIFSLSLIFSLFTLPVELNASKRALKILLDTNCLDSTEIQGAKKVLNAAAMTYVAAVLFSVLELIRFVLFFLIRSE